LALVLLACGQGPAPASDADTADAAVTLPPWRRELPPASAMGPRRGLTPARGIIHLHSPYSHDACDGEPRPVGGGVDEACLASLRAALCATRIDYAALTDHDDSMADEDFATLFSARADDELLTNPAGAPVASRMRCEDGHQVTITVGAENELMPIMLDGHVAGDPAVRHTIYNGDTAAEAATFRAAGGLVWIPHSEQRTIEHLRAIGPDGMEIYQLHANLDPDIRRDFLGLSPSGAIEGVVQFADTTPGGPEPDLALISFLAASDNALGKWDQLLAEGRRVAGSAGTDAHENSFPIMMRDGERGDSYRRMLRWFGNIVLVTDPSSPAEVEAALASGRVFVAFELFGTPVGFDVSATGVPGGQVELGAEVSASAGVMLEVTVPTVFELPPELPVPTIRARVLRVDGAGTTEVAGGPGPTYQVPLDRPGAYRVEVLITPRHLGPYLGFLGPELAERELPWIYASPIYVR
jgi:hypothetical protein